jgi:hypothetical protein
MNDAQPSRGDGFRDRRSGRIGDGVVPTDDKRNDATSCHLKYLGSNGTMADVDEAGYTRGITMIDDL